MDTPLLGHKVLGHRSLGLDSLSTTSCVALGKLLNLSELPFLHLYNGGGNIHLHMERVLRKCCAGASIQCYDHTTNGSFVSPTYLWALGRKDWVLDIGPPSCFFSATYHLVAFDQRCAERTLSDLTRQLSSGFGRRCPSFSHVSHSFIHQQILVDTIPLSINGCGNRGRVIQQDCSSLL